MMRQPKKQSSELLEAIAFPKTGEVIGGVKVLSANASVNDDIITYEIVLPKGTKSRKVPTILRQFFSTQVLSTAGNQIVKHHDYAVVPKNGNVAVQGSMQIAQVVRMNPSMQEFDEEYSKMEMTKPETYFTKHPYKGFNSPQFRAKLFSMVSFMGENYGYCDDKCIYHRRASLIMPKIKITKAVPSAKMMYHTHPRKDEPSLSSADDYLIYMDLSHEPRSIRHFYTVMADRMDHFQIKPKKGSKQNFLKLEEDKIIEEIDAKISDLEKKWDAKIPRDDATKDDNLRYCENITRDLVKWLNTKYGKYFSFKYQCYYKVKKNPPEPTADDLHLKEELLQKAIGDVRTRTYSWPEFDTAKMPHEKYAYWHQMYYTHHVKDSFMTLGVSLTGAQKRRYDQYMNKRFEESTYTNLDALHMLNLAYDIAAQDAKVRDGTGFSSRMKELCEYMGLSEEACETLILLEQIIHQQEIPSEQAKMLAGDYYPLVLLSYYSISAIHTIEKVESGKLDPQQAKYEVYSKLKQEISESLSSFLSEHESLFAQGFVDSYLNPPPMTLKRTDYLVQFPPEALELYDIVEEALSEFSKSKVDPSRPFFTATSKFNLSVPTKGGRVGMMITQSTGMAQVFATTKNPMEDSIEAVNKVGKALYEIGLPVNPDDFDLTFDEPAINPQKAQVIAICGPSGSGKSTTIRNLLKTLPNARTAPTVTTRQKRRSDKPGERIFVNKTEFLHMVSKGELVAVQLQGGGDYYGRRISDFEKDGYVIIDVSLKGVNALRKVFPNVYTVYLEPVDDPELIRKRLLRRGDISAKDAKGRAAIIPQHIESSKKMEFDLRVKTKQGEFDFAAKEIASAIPKKNPSGGSNLRDLMTEEDKSYVDFYKKNMKVVSPFVSMGQRVFVVVETPVTKKLPDDSLNTSGFTRVLLYRRTGVGSTESRSEEEYLSFARILGNRYNADPEFHRAEIIAESPFLKNVVSQHEGYSGAARYSSVMYTPIFGQEGEGIGWLIKGNDPETKDQDTVPPLPSNEDDAAMMMSRFGYRTFYYAGIALTELHPDPDSIPLRQMQKDDGKLVERNPDLNRFAYDYQALLRTDRYNKVNSRVRGSQGELDPSMTAGATVSPLTADEWNTPEGKRKLEAIRKKRKQGRQQVDTTTQSSLPFDNPAKDLFDWFEEWAKLINMKNKELKAFLDSDWGKVAGLSKQEAKDWNNIKSGRVSAKRIMSMRKKIGLGGPKDYIKDGPRIIESYYEKALNNWTGPSDDPMRGETDWDWCKRQVRFNKRAGAFPYNPSVEKRKGPLVKKMKTYARPSRRLLSLWVWGHDPWRWARKNGYNTMSPCPDVPWIGMTEKRKWGKIKVEMSPRVKNNPVRDPDAKGDAARIKTWIPDSGSTLAHFLPHKHFKQDWNRNACQVVYPKGATNLDDMIELDWVVIKIEDNGYKNGPLRSYSYMFRDHPSQLCTVAFKLVQSYRDKLPFYFIAKAGPPKYKYTMAGRRPTGNRPGADGFAIVAPKVKDDRADFTGEIRDALNREIRPVPQDLMEILDDIAIKEGDNDLQRHLEYLKSETYEDMRKTEKAGIKFNYLDKDSILEEAARAGNERAASRRLRGIPTQTAKPSRPSQGTPPPMRRRSPPKVLYHGTSSKMAEIYLQEGKNEHQDQGNIAEHYGALKPEQAYNYALGQTAMDMNYIGNWDGDTPKEIYHPVVLQFDVDGLNVIEDSQERNFTYGWNAGKEFVVMENISPDRISVHKSYPPLPKHGWDDYEQAKISQDELAKLVRGNPKKTPEGRKIPKRYLKGLNKEEMAIAAKEIDKGYKYDINDPKAYEYWKSDIKATARGYKTVPSKYKKKFIEMYGPLPEKGEFLDKMAKATKIKKSILQKVYDKGLAAWRGGHRPGVQQHQWAAGRVYSFVTLGNTVKKGNKKMPDYKLAVEAGLVKENPRGEVYVQDLIDTDDMRKIMTTYKMRVRQMFSTKGSPAFLKRRKKELAKIRKEFNWKGRTAESLFEAVADQINKETKLKPLVKVYRGMIGLDLGQDNMLQHLQEYGAGPFWSTRKESADIYVGGKKYDYSGFFGAKSLLLAGYARLSDVYWADTFETRLFYPEERELEMWRPIKLQSVSVYDINDRANKALISWQTTGKNWKPWIDPRFKPENTYKYDRPIVPVEGPKQNPEKDRSDFMPGIELSNPSEADFFPGDTHSFSPYATAQTIPITALQNPNIKDSEIHGQGLFADENISRGEIVVTDTSDVKYINHSDSPNLTARYLPDETLEYVAKANIKQGSELTLDYRQLAKLTGHPAANEEVQPETLFNPSEWRHGEFAEEDPFEEYF